jgi:hypothetical protein
MKAHFKLLECVKVIFYFLKLNKVIFYFTKYVLHTNINMCVVIQIQE